jgi:hypothetical protein
MPYNELCFDIVGVLYRVVGVMPEVRRTVCEGKPEFGFNLHAAVIDKA